jgi:hypothetical protein
MRAALALIVSTLALMPSPAAIAQDSAAIAATEAACGPKDVKFDVKNVHSQPSAEQPETGKALVYVIQDMGNENVSAVPPPQESPWTGPGWAPIIKVPISLSP